MGACVETVTGESDTTNNCSLSATVTIDRTNRPPRLTGDVDDKVVEVGDSFNVDLSGLFTDPEGDDITSYGFMFRTSGILTGIVNTRTGILSLWAKAVGETIVAVDARDSNGASGDSEDLLKVTVTAAATADKPGIPTGLTATADGQTEIDLSWTKPSDDGGADITGYKIEVSTNGSSYSDLVANTSSANTSYSNTGLSAGSTRYYRVSAINSAGTGAASGVANATTNSPPAATAPGAPTGLTATTDGQTRIDLSWNAPSNTGGATITGYKIEVSTNGTSWSNLVANTRSTSTSYSHTGLTAGNTRYYRVSAINSAGTGAASNVVNATTASSPARTVSDCATGSAVSDAANNPGLVSDCDTLLSIKDTLRGTAILNWSANTPIANWSAITVGGTPLRVTELNTSGEGLTLTGAIPAELGNLTNLTLLRLSSNELTGAIPAELGNLTNLTHLLLHDNELTGAIPAELGNLANLQDLVLYDNELTGAIPAELGNLTNLDQLWLRNNELTGALPAELGNLTNLTHLLLNANQLTGTIPAELGKLANLQDLFLYDNELTGTIPAELGKLANLQDLFLYDNELTGTIPAELGKLTNLNQLWLRNNELTGAIPAELGNLANLTHLSLSNNLLTGAIPAELGNLTKLDQLWLKDNELTGCIPAGLRDVQSNDLTELNLPDCATPALTVSIATCDLTLSFSRNSVTMTGSINASRKVVAVTVTGWFDGDKVGEVVIPSIEAGETESFSITGSVSASSGSCKVEIVDYTKLP